MMSDGKAHAHHTKNSPTLAGSETKNVQDVCVSLTLRNCDVRCSETKHLKDTSKRELQVV